MRKYLIIYIIIISILLGQRPDKNEIITERHSNGLKKLVLVFEGEGLNEILIGKYGFYENGLKRFVELYNNNLKNGKSIYWYENGQKEIEWIYKYGKDFSRKCWDEDGNECDSHHIPHIIIHHILSH